MLKVNNKTKINTLKLNKLDKNMSLISRNLSKKHKNKFLLIHEVNQLPLIISYIVITFTTSAIVNHKLHN